MQSGRPYLTPKPGFLTKLFFRLPVYFYRIRLGRLFDHHILYLKHTGRKTGKVRRNCIEVIYYDSAKKESVVISAYGRHSDWFRNIMQNPPIEIQIGSMKFVPDFRVLAAEEAREILKKVFMEHPGEGKFFLKNVFHLEPTEEQFESLAALVPLVGFRPKTDVTVNEASQ